MYMVRIPLLQQSLIIRVTKDIVKYRYNQTITVSKLIAGISGKYHNNTYRFYFDSSK